MALTALKVKDLTDKGFMGLFDQHEELWKTKAQEAHDYAAKFVVAAGQPVRPDDVIDLLVPAVALSEEFRTFLDEKRLTQKYWRVYFCELVLDRLWGELTEEDDDD
jgi:hypothetical protein